MILPKEYVNELITSVLAAIDAGNPQPPGRIVDSIVAVTKGTDHEICFSQAQAFVHGTLKRRLRKARPSAWDYLVGIRIPPKPTNIKTPKPPPATTSTKPPPKQNANHNHPNTMSYNQCQCSDLKNLRKKKSQSFTPIHQNTRLGSKRKTATQSTNEGPENNFMEAYDENNNNIPPPLARNMKSRVYYDFLKDNPEILKPIENICDEKAKYPSHSPYKPNSKGVSLSVDAPFTRNHCMNIWRPSKLNQHHGKDLSVVKQNKNTDNANINDSNENGTVLRYTYATGCGSQTTGTPIW